MLSFRDFLRESLSTPYQWEWDPAAVRTLPHDNGKTYVTNRMALFSTTQPDLDFEVTFTRGLAWWMSFGPTRESLDDVSGGFHKDVYGVLGTGNAFRVFATVIDILKDFVKLEHPDTIRFVGGGNARSRAQGVRSSSRDSLYRRFVRQADRALPGYVNQTDMGGSETTYTLKRVGATDERP